MLASKCRPSDCIFNLAESGSLINSLLIQSMSLAAGYLLMSFPRFGEKEMAEPSGSTTHIESPFVHHVRKP